MRALPLVVLALAAAPASAQVRRMAVVGVALEGGTVADAESGAHAAAALVQGDARFEYVSPAVQVRDDGPVREAKAIEAKRLFGEAREALDNLSIPKAIATADKATKFYEASDLSAGISGLLDVIALHAMASFAKSDKAAFTNDAQRILALAPDYVWDANRLTPAAEAALEPIAKRVHAAPAASLAVSSKPSAWAYVDGIYRGVTPVTVEGLRPGGHYVTLVANGFELLQERVFAGSGAEPSFALKLATRGPDLLAQIGQVKAGLEKGDAGPAAQGLARLLQADEVLVAGLKGSPKRELVIQRVLVDGTVVGTISRGAEGGNADWQAAAKDLLGRSAPAPKREEPGSGGEVVAPSKAGRRPWGWAAAAVGVGALGGGIALGNSAKARAQDANNVPQIDSATYQRYASQARLQAGVADGLFVAATAAAGAAIFLLLTGYSTSEESVMEMAPGPLTLAPMPGGGLVAVSGRF